MLKLLVWLQCALCAMRRRLSEEGGLTTAELLGNAALGIAALVAIWALLQALGVDIVDWIREELGIS